MRLYNYTSILFIAFALIAPIHAIAQKRSMDVICSNKTTGAVVLRNKKCSSKETKLSNIATLRGATGPSGPTGTTGAQGIQGVAGTPATLCEQADVDGVCLTKVATLQNFLAAAQECAAYGADICSDSQSWKLRENGVLRSLISWTNSFSDNDGTPWNEVNGGASDDNPASSTYYAPCCQTVTPSRNTDQNVNGVRVVYVYDIADADWRTASTMCTAMKADLCDKSQYIVLRNSGFISQRMWASDHSDNDSSRFALAIGSMPDNPIPSTTAGFACCATRNKVECPVTETNGVCVASINNTNTLFLDAANDCASKGARICSISQSAILRNAGAITAVRNWTGSGSDNDGNFAVVGVGNGPDDPNFNSDMFGYACCY